MFRRKDTSEFDNGVSDLGYIDQREIIDESGNRFSRQALSSQSMSAASGLAALRINTPNSYRLSTNSRSSPSPISRDTAPEEHSSIVSQRPRISVSGLSRTSSTLDSRSALVTNSKPSFLTIPNSSTSLDPFGVDIDFTKFETSKVIEPPVHSESPPKRVTNHDFLFIIDDGPGIDHRSWDATCDLVSGVSKRLIPLSTKDSPEFPPETPSISIRFVNNPRTIPRVQNLNQIRIIFNWATPREIPKYQNNRSYTVQKPTLPNIPPLRTLEYHFWTIYNEKLEKNAWVGQNPTTIILFISSPLGNKPDDMDLFIAKCAEKLNLEQIPLPLVSIMVVQCNADPVLHRQLVETRRMITWEWYTPRRKVSMSPEGRRPSGRGSGVNPYAPEPKRRPQRDWVDIITCEDWERAGGVLAIKAVVEREIQRGIQRRKKAQKEAAMNYLTHLGKENTSPVQESTDKGRETIGVAEFNIHNPHEQWDGQHEYHGKGGRSTEVNYIQDYHHNRVASPGRHIDYYD
jgi:hypothetical protein